MRSRPSPSWVLALVVFLVGFAYFGAFVDYGINLHDEGTLLYQSERVADGETLYLDFHAGYTPAIYHLHAWTMNTFGFSLLPGRWLLALVNAAAMAGLALFASAGAPRYLAWFPAFFYAAVIPVHVGEFAAFNVPYPVWYNSAIFVFGLLALWMAGLRGSLVWLGVAGAIAGANFMFKPNAGLLHLAVAGWCLLLLSRPGPGVSSFDRFRSLWWWVFLVGVTCGVLALFVGERTGLREVSVFLVPIVLFAWLISRANDASGAFCRFDIVTSSLVLVASFVLVNIPWMAVTLGHLGVDHFLRAIFYVGANFEVFYYLPYPSIVVALPVGLLGAYLAFRFLSWQSALFRMVDLLVWPGLILGALALFFLSERAVMPEGFFRAIWSTLEPLVYPSSIVSLWIGLAILYGLATNIVSEEGDADRRLWWSLALAGALGMYMQIYPRTDFMHWVTAAPLLLVVGVGIIGVWVEAWARRLPRPRAASLRTAAALVLVALTTVRVAPALSAVLDFDGTLSREVFVQRGAFVELDADRAKIRLNSGRVKRFADLDAIVAYLREATEEGEEVFTFPALDVVSFLSDRSNPTGHGYFFPRWPGHDWEGEVVSDLIDDPPRLAVVFHDHAPFFVDAPVYYFALAEYLVDEFSLLGRIGPYAVFLRDDLRGSAYARSIDPAAFERRYASVRQAKLDDAMPPELKHSSEALSVDQIHTLGRTLPEKSDPRLLVALQSDDPTLTDAAIEALRYARDPVVAAALVKAVAEGRLSRRSSIIAMKNLPHSADCRVVEDVLRLRRYPDLRIQDLASSALFHMSSRGIVEEYWFEDEYEARCGKTILRDSPVGPNGVDAKTLRNEISSWLYLDRMDPRLRSAALWMARWLPRDEAVPALIRASASGDVLTAAAAFAELVRLDEDDDAYDSGGQSLIARDRFLQRGLALMATEDIWAPRAVYQMLSDEEPKFVPSLDPAVGRSGPAQRNLAWAMAAADPRRYMTELVNAANDPDRIVRSAVLWAIEQAGAVEQVDVVRAGLEDPDFEVRGFARRALAVLEGQGGT